MTFDLSRPLSPRRETVVALVIIGLGLLLPLAVYLAFRLTVKSCLGNFLGLPWPPATEVAIAIVAFLATPAAIAATGYGFVRRETRIASICVTVYWVVATPPVLIAMFLSFFGDPAAGCVPV